MEAKSKKTWPAYLSSALLLIGGIFQMVGGHPKSGVLLIVVSIVSVFLFVAIFKRGDK